MEEGYLSSNDFAANIAELHKRKSELNKLKKKQDDVLYELRHLPKDHQDRAKHVRIINNLIAEQSAVSSRLKEFSVLYQNSLDQILLSLLREHHHDIYENLKTQAKDIYARRNKKG